MAIYNGPPRGGSRGGRDQFNWDDVKADKDREFYLGHSVKATTGRWAKGKDIFWYNKDKTGQDDEKLQQQVNAVKAREEQLMQEALGLKPKSAPRPHHRELQRHEVKELLSRVSSDGADAAAAPADDADRVHGLGYAPRAMGGMEVVERLEGTIDDDRNVAPRHRDGDARAHDVAADERVTDKAKKHKKDKKHSKEKKKHKSEKALERKKDKEHKREHKKHKHEKLEREFRDR